MYNGGVKSNSLPLPTGPLSLPDFLPDATRGVVRSLDSADLESCDIQALVMNTVHLMQNPGSSTIQALGGLHRMSGWTHPIITDSGGFQIYSLIHQNPKYGNLNNKGANFRDDAGRKYHLTPEKSIQLQISYGSDVVICLDDCTHVDAPYETQAASVRRTIDWARRARAEFDRLVEQKGLAGSDRPHLFAVVQGGGERDLRRQCAEALLETGFDGYGYGGWPLDNAGRLLSDLLGYVRELIPAEFPLHALGVAHPGNILECSLLGYDIFDGAMPTRDARHARLYVFDEPPEQLFAAGGHSAPNPKSFFSYLYALDDKHTKANAPISPYCDCLACRRYSLGYLRHLFKIEDTLAYRLATIHNLRFMTQLMEGIRRITPILTAS